MQERPTQALLTRCDDLFGYGWKGLMCKALNIHQTTISNMTPTSPSYMMIESTVEWMTSVPTSKWPDRFSDLAERHKARTKKLAAQGAAR